MSFWAQYKHVVLPAIDIPTVGLLSQPRYDVHT